MVYSRGLYCKKQNGVKTGHQKKECHENATFLSWKIKKNKYKRGISATLVVQHRGNLSVVSHHVYLKLISREAMKRFNTKKDLLRYLGKNEDDRKLVTRMIERGEVRLEWRVYIIDEEEISEVPSNSSDLANRLSNDLEYLNKEYERLEVLLDYSLRKCYGIMKKKGLVGSEDSYDDFYEKITDGYEWKTTNVANVAQRSDKSENAGLTDVVSKFGIKKASDLI